MRRFFAALTAWRQVFDVGMDNAAPISQSMENRGLSPMPASDRCEKMGNYPSG
ncbi:MAG: hypothetical protein ABI478_00380 [Propionivibrio sp.]